MIVSFLVALTSAATVVVADGPWPPINEFYSFAVNGVKIYTYDGSKLETYRDIVADVKVDAARSKIIVHATVKVPILGHVHADIAIDTMTGMSLEYVPMLRICKHTPLNLTANLNDLLKKVYDPNGGITTYDGESGAPWDATKMWKFSGSYKAGEQTVSAEAYVLEDTHSLQWGTSNFKGTQYVVNTPGGEQQATFADADFVISGCNANDVVTDPEDYLSVFWN